MPASTAAPTTPEQVFRRSLELLLAKDISGWLGLWAEDGVVEFPFAPPGAPRRLDGKEAVRAYMADYPDHIDLADIPWVEIHTTGDPEVAVAEWRGVGRVVATGEPYDMTYIVVLTVRDGLFTHYRDYWNPLVVQEVTDGGNAPFGGGAR
ncbi:nuclear transport factor 2 family protein [Streptomyces daliensis]|uniref:Nuclear transport factor 2 family protein n=1 Tax=Streptomyces daliensis TaxID=299421 RepID=A0A8T4IX55_9ACTN|nr:nuclear transport factor 2 family protein [Streptomyces daliensis]